MAQDPFVRGSAFGGIPDSWVAFSSINHNAFILFTNTDYTVVSSLTLNNSVFVNLSLDKAQFIIIGSRYSSPSSDIESDFDEWTSQFPFTDNLLIGADLNVHLKALGYAREDHRTESFLEMLVVNNLHILNDPQSEHTWVVDKRQGRPDVTLGGADICNDLVTRTLFPILTISTSDCAKL